MDRLEEKRKIKAQAFHERKVSSCDLFRFVCRRWTDCVITVGRGQAASEGTGRLSIVFRETGDAGLLDGWA